MSNWTPSSWRSKPIMQQPAYPDPTLLKSVENHLAGVPPLVFPNEIQELSRQLKRVAEGEAFLLQGGDCAESFDEFNAGNIQDTCKIIMRWP